MGYLVYVREKMQMEANHNYFIGQIFVLPKNAARFAFDFTKPSLCTGTKAIMRNKIIKYYKSLKIEVSILRFIPKISKFFNRNSVTNTNILKYMQ